MIKMTVSKRSEASIVLDDHFSQIYENILSINAPLASTPDYLRRVRKSHVEKQVQKVLTPSYEERKKILDPLVEYVLSLDLSDAELLKGAIHDLKEKLEENPDFGRYFDRLKRTFQSFNPSEQKRVMKMSITKMQSNIETIRHVANDQIMEIKNPQKLILLDQILYTILSLFDETLSDLSKDKTKINKLSAILVLTLKLEAVRRGEFLIADLEQDLSTATSLIPPKHTTGLKKKSRQSVLKNL